MKKKYKFILIAIFLIFLTLQLNSILYAENQDPLQLGSEHGGAYVELGFGHDPDAIGGEIGCFTNPSVHKEIKASFAFIASENYENIFTGASIGIRFQAGTKIKPFVGAGIFAGYTKKEIKAEDDKEDNDNDGKIDEPGEKKEIIDNVMGTVYPEAGVHFLFDDHTRITFAAKYHITTEGRQDDFAIYSAAFSVLF